MESMSAGQLIAPIPSLIVSRSPVTIATNVVPSAGIAIMCRVVALAANHRGVLLTGPLGPLRVVKNKAH